MKTFYQRFHALSKRGTTVSILPRAAMFSVTASAYYYYKNSTWFSEFINAARVAEALPRGKEMFNPYKRSKECQPLLNADAAVILGGSSNPSLSQGIAKYLGVTLASTEVKRFADGELSIKVAENVMGKDVYIIQPTCPPVNDTLVELILTISAVKRAGAKSVTCVIPYYGYARQDRKFQGQNTPISGADAAQLLQFMGADRLVGVDLHVSQAQGYIQKPFDNLEGAVAGIDYFRKNLEDMDRVTVVSPDAGGLGRAKAFHKHLLWFGHQNVTLAMLNKERKEANKIEKMELVGNVEGKDCILIDDMIDTAGTLCEAARVLKEKGARKVYAFASHGLFNGEAAVRIRDSALEKVITTDSLPVKDSFRGIVGDKYTQVSIDLLLAETIRRIHQGESFEELYKFPLY